MPPWPTTPPSAAERAAYADAEPRPFWLADLPRPEPAPALVGTVEADLCIVGGGFTGLWAALHARRDDPARDVVLLEGETCGFGASGRNGGFASSSLTHGLENGVARFPEEARELERLGLENLEGLADDLAQLGIDCDLERTGDISVVLDRRRRGRARGRGGPVSRLRARRRGARRRCDAGRGRVAHVPRRALGTDGIGPRASRQARARTPPGRARGRRAGVRAHDRIRPA